LVYGRSAAGKRSIVSDAAAGGQTGDARPLAGAAALGARATIASDAISAASGGNFVTNRCPFALLSTVLILVAACAAALAEDKVELQLTYPNGRIGACEGL